MQWWNDLISWLTSSAARPTVYAGIVLFVAVLLAGLLASWIASMAVRRVVAQRDREAKNAAVAALIDAATEASVWNSLTPQEQVLADRTVGQADILVRLLPIKGADVAANWASHQLHELKRASATFGYQLDPAVERVILRCLEVDPARRPHSAYAVFGALPGGDPLAAAVAAGETPSPELVANAGVEGRVRPLFARLALAAVLAGFFVLSLILRPFLAGLDRPAGVLSVRAATRTLSMSATARPTTFSRRAASKSATWPAWSAPIVGTSPTPSRWRAARVSAIVRSVFTACAPRAGRPRSRRAHGRAEGAAAAARRSPRRDARPSPSRRARAVPCAGSRSRSCDA